MIESLLSRIPAEVTPELIRLLEAIIDGDIQRAEREAKATAQAVALKLATREAAK